MMQLSSFRRSDYVAACPSNQDLFAEVYAILERHPRASLLDLFRSPQFTDADFGDSDHINRNGALKLTKMVDDGCAKFNAANGYMI